MTCNDDISYKDCKTTPSQYSKRINVFFLQYNIRRKQNNINMHITLSSMNYGL